MRMPDSPTSSLSPSSGDDFCCVWLPPAVRESFIRIRKALYRRRFSQVDYLSGKFRKRFPAYAGFYLDMEANAHRLRGRREKALALLLEANACFKGESLPTLRTLIRTLLDQEKPEQAREYLEKGLALFPDDPALRLGFCNMLFQSGQLRQAVDKLREHCRKTPSEPFLKQLGECCFQLGLQQEGMEAYFKALEFDPTSETVWSNLLFHSHYLPNFTAAEQRELLRRWHETVCAALPSPAPSLTARPREAGKKLRIGLFSPGFCSHPVGRMAGPALFLLSKLPDCELYFYSSTLHPDERDPLRRMLRKAASKWVEIGTWPDERLYRAVMADKPDIAVDMAGHGMGGIMTLFARRLAPVQVKWVGALFDTTGLPQMDYLLSDRFETPEGSDAHYAEKLVRLPHSYISYDLQDCGDTERLKPDSPFCFGSFNNIYKLNSEIAGVWSAVLKRVPGSVLLLKTPFLRHPEAQEAARALFTAHGVAAERILTEGPSPHGELMQTYRRVDIALDSWPYTGGLTTLEALWMGVPVVTMPGPSFAGRHALSHLCNAGLESLVANSAEEYIDIAVRLAGDRNLLRDLRILLPYSLAQSPLVRHEQLAADLHTAFRTMWTRCCQGLPPIAMRFEQPSPVPEALKPFVRNGFAKASA